jgi:KUP system potassium uptake protein
MYVWHYVHRNAYEVEKKVSSEYILSLGSSLDVTKVSGIGLLYSELAQGVPTIFAHFIRNLPAMHSVLVFICVRYLPVNTVAAGERSTYFDNPNPSAPSYMLRTITINHCPII